MDSPRDIARGLLGPAYQPVADFASGLFGIMDPRLDMQDFREGGSKVAEGIREGDPVRTAAGVGQNLTGAFGLLGGPVVDAATAGGKMLMAFPVFHGTPHRYAAEAAFPQGRPRLDKMGTGEGAQAYGWGWYSAENPAVAREYQNDLSRAYVSAPTGENVPYGQHIENLDTVLKGKAKLHPDQRRQIIREVVENNLKPGDVEGMGEPWESAYRAVIDANTGYKDAVGQFYKFDIPDDVQPNLLDWDAPLSEQPEAVRRALGDITKPIADAGKRAASLVRKMASEDGLADWAKRDLLKDADFLESSGSAQAIAGRLKQMPLNYGIDSSSSLFGKYADEFNGLAKTMQFVPNMNTGAGVYALLMAQHGSDKAASEALRAAGIPGLKYFDGMSRDSGKGTRNYVIWDQGVLDRTVPLERNNKPTGLKPGDYGLLGTR